jgi:hypothetical protein
MLHHSDTISHKHNNILEVRLYYLQFGGGAETLHLGSDFIYFTPYPHARNAKLSRFIQVFTTTALHTIHITNILF